MSFSDWQSPASTSSNKQEYSFICMSTTVDDLSYTPSEQEKSRDAAQIVATGRRSWKTLKGKGEAVWPPLLEAALLEALERYQPEAVGTKSNKSLGRFPMRNRFISDYIFETTGKRRTPKQVGSRLQQLRDTCKGDKILNLISHRSTPEPSASSQSEYSQTASPSPPPDQETSSTPYATRGLSPSNPLTVYVQISLGHDTWPTIAPAIHFVGNSANDPQNIHLSSSSGTSVEFLSSTALSLQSTFTVYVNGSNAPMHTEVVPLTCISSPMHRSGWLYGSQILPAFWTRFSLSRDLSKYTIFQTLNSTHPRRQDASSAYNVSSACEITVIYKFDAPRPAPRRRQSNTLLPGYQKSALPMRPISMPRASVPAIPLSEWQPSVVDCMDDRSWSPLLTTTHQNDFSFDMSIPQIPVYSEPHERHVSRPSNVKAYGGMCSTSFNSYSSATPTNPTIWPSAHSLYAQQFGFSTY